ncbi:MAG: M56 family metallopeptidase [Acidobacteria bacterium]|nr:M56 family metallopeptidase [Acidobacteriota bacterium]
MNAIVTLLDGPFADALGRALVHLVWQASLVALLLAGVLAAMRRASAEVRYAASCAALVLTVALPVATAFLSFDATVPSATITTGLPAAAIPPVAVAAQAPTEGTSPRPVAAWPLDPALPWVVGFWLAGVTLLSVRIGVALLSARRLAESGIDTLPREWRASLSRLTSAMRIDRAVRLLESTRVDVPTVVGWLRPVILVPASALTGLTPQQLETVLAHELAHIRRHDFVVNLVQTVVETLLFYHPAVWWISNRVRVEREHCCDDAAVAICGDAVGYARALTTLEEMRTARVPTALLASTGGSLLDRVRRLVGLAGDDLGSTRPIAALIALTIVTAAIAIPLSARVGRTGAASGTTITVDAAHSDEGVAGIWVDGPAPGAPGASNGGDEPVAWILQTSEIAAAEIEVRQAKIERQLARIDRERHEIDTVIAAAMNARNTTRAQLAMERDAMERAIAEALSAREVADAEIAAILAEVQPTPPARPAPAPRPERPAEQPAPRAVPSPLAEPAWSWRSPVPPVTPVPAIALPPPPASPAPIARTPHPPIAPLPPPAPIARTPHPPIAPLPPLAPIARTPHPPIAPRAFMGTRKPVDPDNPAIDDLVFLHVDRAELERMREALQRSREALEAARLRLLDVDDAYVAELERAGLSGLSKQELRILKTTGVDGEWVKHVRASGYRSFSVSELAGLHASGVDGDYLRDLASAGFTGLDASQLIRLHAAGFDADDLRQWKK